MSSYLVLIDGWHHPLFVSGDDPKDAALEALDGIEHFLTKVSTRVCVSAYGEQVSMSWYDFVCLEDPNFGLREVKEPTA